MREQSGPEAAMEKADWMRKAEVDRKEFLFYARFFQIPLVGQLTRFEREGPLSASCAAAVAPPISRRTATDATTTSINSGSN
jgi:hypothetical protein